MRRCRLLPSICLLLCCLPLLARAASETSPAYVEAVLTAPLAGTDALSVTLAPDEAACKKAYGKNWNARCSAAPGEDGAPVRGLRLSPDIPGEWRWSDGATLEFRPRRPWPEATAYALSLEGLPLPSRIRLTGTGAAFATPPLAALSADAKVWIDPDLEGERAVSFDVAFTTPPNREAVRRLAVLEAGGMELAAPEFVWSGDGASCLVKARILRLPAERAPVRLRLGGVAAKVERSGTRWKVPPKRETALVSVTVPGAADLFRIRRAELTPARDAALVGEYRLNLETSLLVRPDAVAKAITALRLPRTQHEEAVEPTVWTKAPAIDAASLKRAEPVKIEPLQPGDQPADKLSFRVSVPQDGYVLLSLPAGFGPEGYALARPWREVFHAAPFRAEVDFLQPGNVLALGGERKLDLRGGGLTEIRWRATRVLKPFWGFLAAQHQPFGNENIYFDPLGDAREGSIPLPRTEPGVPQFAVLDMDPLIRDGRGLVRIELSGMDGEELKARAERLVLVTDLGLIVKKGADGRRDVFVCSLSEGGPVAGAAVRVLGANGLPVAETVSDAGGRAALPSLSGLERERRPVAVTAQRGEDMAWLPLNDGSLVVDYSRFPVRGQIGADGVNAYVFGQRGMFRPGETLRFGMIVRRGDWKPLPPDLPLVAELRDPSEIPVLRRRFAVGADGLAELEWTAPEDAPTGRYRLDVLMPDASGGLTLGSGAVRVEEFQPDTLSVAAAIDPAPGKGWLNASSASAEITLRNLYGSPAADRRVRGTVMVRPARLSFPGYEAYAFHDAMPYKGSALRLDLNETRTDAQGRAVLPLPLERLRGGTLDCTLLVEGFEPGGGRSVTALRRFLVSPLGAVLGYRPTGAGGNLDFIPQGSEAALEFVALGPALERVNPGELTFSVAERRYVTSLVTDTQGRYQYDETPVDREIAGSKLAFGPGEGGASLRWPVPTDRPGEFLLTVRDAAGRTVSLVPFTVAGNDDLRVAASGEAPSGNLRLHLDKADYAPGETVKVFLSSPFEGTGLITLERDGVAAHRWFKVRAGNAVREIAVPEGFEGRAYVNVSLARALSSPDVFMRPHAYAVAPITVNGKARDIGLRLDVLRPEAVPGGDIVARLNAGRPGKAILFAVDEGVLRLTAFESPDPLRYLLYDRALEVETQQLFDLLMPDHGRFRIPAFGGGVGLSGGRVHNPFKRKGEPPLSWWSGIVDVGPGESRFTIPLPGHYNGTVRLMAVAVSPDAAGSAQAEAAVRGPVVLTPQLPVLAAPGDAFEASLAVANNTDRPSTFRLGVEPAPALRLTETPPAEIAVEPGGETVVPFRVEVGDVLGDAALSFSVTDASGNRTDRTASLSVRPASPLRESLRVGVTSAPITLETGRELYRYGAAGSASVSTLPLPALRGLVRYLDAYPYTCVEQRISRAMPYALLMDRPELLAEAGRSPEDARRLARERTDEAVRAIRSALMWRGVAPWPGADYDPLVTAYAADFLLTLREAGAALPGGLLSDVFDALEAGLDAVPATLEEARIQAYGLWVLTREGRITAQAVERQIDLLEDRLPGWRKDVTSTLLAGCCAIMRMQDKSRRLIALSGTGDVSPEAPDRLDALACRALRASVLARQFPDLSEADRDGLAGSLFDEVNGGRYVSLSAALGIRALLDMGKAAAPSLSGVSLRCASMQPGFLPSEAAPVALPGLLTLSLPGCAAYALDVPPSSPPLYWEVSSQGFDRRPPSAAVAEGLEVTREYLDAEGVPVTKAKLGDVLTVSVTARSHGGPVADAVVVDLLPGGFEQVLSSESFGGEDAGGYVGMDRREDRVVAYTPLSVTPRTLTYKVRAVSRGTFALPPVQAEAMYARSLRANSASGVFVVE